MVGNSHFSKAGGDGLMTWKIVKCMASSKLHCSPAFSEWFLFPFLFSKWFIQGQDCRCSALCGIPACHLLSRGQEEQLNYSNTDAGIGTFAFASGIFQDTGEFCLEEGRKERVLKDNENKRCGKLPPTLSVTEVLCSQSPLTANMYKVTLDKLSG